MEKKALLRDAIAHFTEVSQVYWNATFEAAYEAAKQRGGPSSLASNPNAANEIADRIAGETNFKDRLALAVIFRWRDSAHGNKKRLMTLPVDEFLRRFLLHLLPRGFMRIRNFGFLANRRRAEFLPLCFRLLQQSDQPAAGTHSPAALPTPSHWNCPLCGGTMQVVDRLSVAQLLVRSPPHPSRCAA